MFTWWADGGEKAGLDGLVGQFSTDCADFKFVNGAVAGGAGANAKQVLASRLAQSDPPDTFQAHAGAELNDYIDAGQIEDLSALYQEWGLTKAFPQGLIDNLTVDGKIYSVPANIHRANVLWSNKTVARQRRHHRRRDDAGRVLRRPGEAEGQGCHPARARQGLDPAHAVRVGAHQRPRRREVHRAVERRHQVGRRRRHQGRSPTTQRLLSYTNTDRDTFDWTDAEKLIMDGKAGYQLMGDWEAADLDAKKFTDYGYSVFPGNGDTFQWLADSFVLPKGAPNPEGTKCWLKTVGSAAGQKAFNTKKGSIPARTDAAASDFPAYQQAAIADWKSQTQVPSCAHGSACSQGWQGALNSAMGKFSIRRRRRPRCRTALVAAAGQFAK